MVEIKYVESISLNLLHLTFADKEIMCLRCHYLKLVWSHNFCHNLHVYYLSLIHLRICITRASYSTSQVSVEMYRAF